MTNQDPARAFLMGGGGPKSAFSKYDRPGTTKGGVILEWDYVQQRDIKDNSLKFWADGNPMMQLVITIQTDERDPATEDDDGRRRLFAKGEMTKAIRAAIKAANADFIEKGGTLYVQYTGDGPSAGAGLDGPKLYAAHYAVAPVGYGSIDPAENGAGGLVMSAPPVATAPTAVRPAAAPVAQRAAETAQPHADEQAAINALVGQGLVAAGSPAHTAPAVASAAAPAAAPAPAAPPADMAAALAALSPAERAALGLPPA